MDRRAFLRGAGIGLLGVPGLRGVASAAEPGAWPLREARYYEPSPRGEGEVECTLCPRKCQVGNLERGYCGVRENREGTYYTLVYGLPCSVHVDPIEKKPFFHVLPGSQSFSLATAGCNMHCKFCQNWEISQSRPEQIRSIPLPPSEAASAAKKAACETIASTYTEPTVFIEYVIDIAQAAKERGIRSVVVTAAYIEERPLTDLCGAVDAIKVDLKAIHDDFYRDYCDSTLQPVLDALVTIRRSGVWLELVYLVIPTLNDTDEQFRETSRWIRGHLGVDVPVHFSRFHPAYRLKNLPPTPLKTVQNARDIARAEGLQYVYLGNVPPGTQGESSYCPGCGSLLIERSGYNVRVRGLRDGACAACGHPVPGIWS
jgi:pyruvate formate lyase activating enzyme